MSTAPTSIYTLSLHDALPISSSPTNTGVRPTKGASCMKDAIEVPLVHSPGRSSTTLLPACNAKVGPRYVRICSMIRRSEEHTSELQSPCNLVCRLLLEKKKKT